MAEKIALEFSIGDGPAITSMRDLKKQLKEAQFEALALSERFGATSKEAIEAAKRVASLKDAIGDAKDLTEAFNPDAKFKALGGALQGVAGGFSAVQGAMALFGAESEDVQKTLLKVQSALAISEGLNSVMASIDAFKNLGAVVKSYNIVQKALAAGQKLWNLAMAASPIGLLIASITALIAAGAALVSWFKSSSAEAKRNEAAVKSNTDAVNKQSEALSKAGTELDRNQKQQLAMAKASGMNAEAIRQLEIKLIDEKIAFANSSLEAAKNTLEKQKNALASLKAADADDELIKAQEDNVKTASDLLKTETEDYQKALDEKVDIQNRHKVEIQQVETDAENERKKKAADDYNKRKEKEKQEREERLAANKKGEEDIAAMKEEIYLQSIKDDDERAQEKLRLDYERKKKEIEQSKASEKVKNEQIKLLTQQFFQDQNALIDAENEKQRKKKEEEDNKRIEAEKETNNLVNEARLAGIENNFIRQQEAEAIRFQTEIDNLLERLNNKEITEDEYNKRREALAQINEINLNKIKKDANDAQQKLDQERFNNQMELAQKTSGILNQFADVIGKQTAVGKGLAIAAALIDTYAGAMKAFRATYSPIGPVDVAMRFASVAATIATGIKNVKEIAKVKVPGGAGGSGSIPNAPSATSGVMAPVPAQLSGTALNQQMINSMNNATNRSFVLESDISGNQERIQRLNRAARIS